MAVLASADSTLPYFANVLADIGDEQSIANDLSTFSAHLRRINECLQLATDDSLVLLDELGSGTDPEEGSALAVAVAEALLQKGCLSVVSSHYASLKALAWTEASALNASMEFDDQASRPTYRLVSGFPGASHALATAKRIGLPGAIVERAAAIIQSRGDPAFDLIQRLSNEQQLIADERQLLASTMADLSRQQQALAIQATDLQRERLAVAQQQLGQLDSYLAGVRSQAEALLRRLHEQVALAANSNLAGADIAGVMGQAELELARSTRGELAELSQELATTIAEHKITPRATQVLKEGDRVRVAPGNNDGVVLKIAKKGQAQVEVQGKRLYINVDALTVLPPVASPRGGKRVSVSYDLAPRAVAALTLDVRGMRLVEALAALELQMDGALVQNLEYFSIIHGTGEGVLQKGIREYLAKNSHVRTFNYARPEEGGFGKTLVYLG
jgi:DNA mismatch repair protein MutS2